MTIRLAASFACAFLASATALFAEPAVGVQAPPAPAAKSQMDKQGDLAGADLPAKTKSGLKLAGLVTFVANSCPALNPDYDRFKTALTALGLTTEDLKKPDLKAIYLGYTARYVTDAKANCERARLAFGPKGSTIPDLFATR